MAEGGIRPGEGGTGPVEPARRGQPGRWARAITGPLQRITAALAPRYQNTLQTTQSAAAPAPRPSFWDRVKGVATGIGNMVSGAVTAVGDAFKGAVRTVGDAFNGAVKTVQDKGFFGAAAQWTGQAWEGVKSIGNAIGGVISGAFNAVKDFVGNALPGVTSFFSSFLSSFRAQQKAAEHKHDEERRGEQKREERRRIERSDDNRRLEDAVGRAKAIASAQDFQAQHGLIDKVTNPDPSSQIDNAALTRIRERREAEKA